MDEQKLRRKFVKDYGLPITIFQSPYFEYYLDLFESLYRTRSLYTLFEKEVQGAGGIDQYVHAYNELKNRIIAHVVEKEAFQTFNNSILEQYNVKVDLPKAKLYHPDNHGKRFLSIDLEKANFYALRYFDADIVDGEESYIQWLKRFTNSEHVASSKNLRQIIFGNLNPKKQQKLQKYITYSFLEVIEQYVDKEKIMSASHDEIVIEMESDLDKEELKESLMSIHNHAFPIHINEFILKVQEPHVQFGYVKEDVDNGTVEFKCVPASFMAQAYKKYLGESLHEYDLLFFYEGQVATFLKSKIEN